MDFQRFGIDPRLAEAAESLTISFFLYEKLLALAVEKQDNICAKISLTEGREEVMLLPALQWLLSGQGRKVLVAVPDRAGAERCALAVAKLGAGSGIETCLVDRVSLSEGGPSSPVFEGDPSAAVVIGQQQDLVAACPPLNLRDYGFLVVDGADRMAELPSESIRRFSAALLPSWERRSILVCSKISVKAKALAWDLADNPSELSIEGEIAKAQSVVKETWSLPGESKLKFLLALLERERPDRVAVFCNLKDSADVLARRIAANGLDSDYLFSPLAVERKNAVLDRIKAADRSCLILTDQGAEGLEPSAFPLVVNFDIPLEAELFVKRIEMLDRSAPGAKVVSLACERYIYGLSAIESYIDEKLEIKPVDDSMFTVADKSEGMSFESKHGRDPRSREVRQGESRRGPPKGNRRSGGKEHGPSRNDGYPRELSPEIRKSISEATGGALDMNASALPPSGQRGPRGQGPQGAKGPKGGSPRGTQGGQGSQGSGNKGERGRDARDARMQGPRGGQGRSQRDRGQGPRGQNPHAEKRDGQGPGSVRNVQPRPGNPYDTPIEERMKHYREKYGQSLGPEKQEGQKGPHNKGQGRNPAQGGQSQRRPQPKAPQTPPPQRPSSPEPDRGAEGLLGRLFGAFKKKPE
jgi:ATP-dependent RNA helicase RhlB